MKSHHASGNPQLFSNFVLSQSPTTPDQHFDLLLCRWVLQVVINIRSRIRRLICVPHLCLHGCDGDNGFLFSIFFPPLQLFFDCFVDHYGLIYCAYFLFKVFHSIRELFSYPLGGFQRFFVPPIKMAGYTEGLYVIYIKSQLPVFPPRFNVTRLNWSLAASQAVLSIPPDHSLPQ